MNTRSPIKYAATTLALGFGLAVAVPAVASANAVRPDPTAVEYAVHPGGTNWDTVHKQGQALMRPDPTAVEYAVHPDGSNWDNASE